MASAVLSLTTFAPLSATRVTCRRFTAQNPSRPRSLAITSAVRSTERTAVADTENAARVSSDPVVRSTAGAAFASLAAFFPTALPVLAEEAADALAAGGEPPEWLLYFLLVIPAVAYGGFYVFRGLVNPRAGLLDYLFVLASVVIVANIFTTLFLKIRLY